GRAGASAKVTQDQDAKGLTGLHVQRRRFGFGQHARTFGAKGNVNLAWGHRIPMALPVSLAARPRHGPGRIPWESSSPYSTRATGPCNARKPQSPIPPEPDSGLSYRDCPDPPPFAPMDQASTLFASP